MKRVLSSQKFLFKSCNCFPPRGSAVLAPKPWWYIASLMYCDVSAGDTLETRATCQRVLCITNGAGEPPPRCHAVSCDAVSASPMHMSDSAAADSMTQRKWRKGEKKGTFHCPSFHDLLHVCVRVYVCVCVFLEGLTLTGGLNAHHSFKVT